MLTNDVDGRNPSFQTFQNSSITFEPAVGFALSGSELLTLIAMAQVSESLEDAQDTLSIYSCLPEIFKPQLRQALKGLPDYAKRLLALAANTPAQGGVA